MKQTTILFSIFLLFSGASFAQIFTDTNDKYKFEGGIEPGGILDYRKDRITYEKNYLAVVELNPFFGYFPVKKINWSIGVKGEFIFVKSDLISLPSLYGFGIYSKYIFKKTLKYRFFKNIRFYGETSFSKINYIYDDEVPVYETKLLSFEYPDKEPFLKHSAFGINAGAMISLKKGFYFNIYEQYIKFTKGRDNFLTRFSFSYVLKEKTQEEIITEQNKKLQKKYKTKEKEPNQNFLNGFTVGTSLTYIWDDSHPNDYPENQHFYQEYTWNLNFAVNLSRRFTAGIQVLNIFTEKTFGEKNNYFIYGFFSQFDFLPHKKTSLFAELSINRGNYCTCGILDPYKKNNLWYYGLGGGAELPLKKISERLFLDLSFINYNIINKIKTKYNYTQYIIGLNYHFGKKRK